MTTKLAITLVVLFAVTCHGFLARGRAKELAIMLQGGDTDFPNPGAGKNVQSSYNIRVIPCEINMKK